MPIEIKELIIRASVRDESGPATERGALTGDDLNAAALREEEIVKRCTEQVMAILNIKNER